MKKCSRSKMECIYVEDGYCPLTDDEYQDCCPF